MALIHRIAVTATAAAYTTPQRHDQPPQTDVRWPHSWAARRGACQIYGCAARPTSGSYAEILINVGFEIMQMIDVTCDIQPLGGVQKIRKAILPWPDVLR